jgi:NAD(P)-dependent dehydrogenase (short-subunit alcohol dehydrogenase family)
LQETVHETVEQFAHIDVVANTAFYDPHAAVEEITAADAQDVFQRTVFGTLNVLRAALPVLRSQRHGHILQAAPSYSQRPAPGTAMMTATIYAAEGLTDVLTAELAPLGIHVTLVETPSISGSDDFNPANVISDYDATVRTTSRLVQGQASQAALDNAAVGAIALMAAVDARDAPPRMTTARHSATRLSRRTAQSHGIPETGTPTGGPRNPTMGTPRLPPP